MVLWDPNLVFNCEVTLDNVQHNKFSVLCQVISTLEVDDGGGDLLPETPVSI